MLRLQRFSFTARLVWLISLSFSPALAQLNVTLSTSAPTGQPVGTTVVLSATVTGATLPLYQFLVQPNGGTASIARDYSPQSSFPWTSIGEGGYTLSVQVTDTPTGLTAQASIPFQLVSLITSGTPMVSPTANPLVVLYSAPPCTGQIRAYFQAATSKLGITPWVPCQGSASVNFYVAGMYANTTYFFLHQVQNAGVSTYGPRLSYLTGALPAYLPKIYLGSLPNTSTDLAQLVTMVSPYSLGTQVTPFATDLYGRIVWYLPAQPDIPYTTLVRPTPAATLILLPGANSATGNNALSQVLQEVDLVGNIVHETTVPRINAQLAAMGQDTMNWFSHEGLRLPNGHTLTFGSVEKLLTDVQGPGVVDVVGDMILDLDPQFQVAWVWNSFQHMDTARKAVNGETCRSNLLCGPLYLGTVANDWTHGNSIHYLPDGNLIISQRNQDWCLKIDYSHGTGTGAIIWRLGNGGDFTAVSNDPWPWFSHQHDFGFDGTNYEVYDNGNMRYKANGYTGHSRGQVWALNEAAKTATLVLNVDLGAFSPVVGTAQYLSNGNYQFLNGNLASTAGPASQPVEVLPDGTRNLVFYYATWAYRVFRMTDLYSYAP